jgi:hypothetical protein
VGYPKLAVSARKHGAGDGTRTRDVQLGKLAFYQLNYSRSLFLFKFRKINGIRQELFSGGMGMQILTFAINPFVSSESPLAGVDFRSQDGQQKKARSAERANTQSRSFAVWGKTVPSAGRHSNSVPSAACGSISSCEHPVSERVDPITPRDDRPGFPSGQVGRLTGA